MMQTTLTAIYRTLCVTGVAIALTCLAIAPVFAQVALAPDHPQRYTVVPGDTLWGIAGRFLRDPWRWNEVWEENPDVSNPNLIYPGDVLTLSFRDGRPRIRNQRAGGGMRVVKLTPRVRVTELEAAIPTIPLNAIAPFLSRPVVTDSRTLDDAPYVVGFPEDHILAGTGGTLYVRSIMTDANDRFDVLRPGQEYRDPDTNEVLGYEALSVASAALERPGDPATLMVTRSSREVEIGDRVLPSREDAPIRGLVPRPAPLGMLGKIVAVLNGVSQIGQYDIVVLNRGLRERVELGQVFEVYQGGTQRRDQVRSQRAGWNWRNETPLDTSFWYGDWEITGWSRDEPDPNAPLPLHVQARRESTTYISPNSRSGVVMVFRVFPRVSFALVMHADRPMHIGEVVATPRDI